MMNLKVKRKSINGEEELESLYLYCSRLSKKNNSLLYLLENYLNKKLLEDNELSEIRDLILTVSADISKLSYNIVEDGDDSEGLQ